VCVRVCACVFGKQEELLEVHRLQSAPDPPSPPEATSGENDCSSLNADSEEVVAQRGRESEAVMAVDFPPAPPRLCLMSTRALRCVLARHFAGVSA
jgi:hypothetical protein